MQTNSRSDQLFTVGHSNLDFDRFLELLRGVGITAIADVRSQPYSRRLPQFNRPELERGLKAAGIAYAFLGEALGGRPQQASLYDAAGVVNYEQVRATAAFQQGLNRLGRGADQFCVAMLCGEEDPLDCHRGLMITPALRERGLYPRHVRKGGRLESTAEMETRLLAATGVANGLLDGLFAAMISEGDRHTLLGEAYRMMAQRKAYRRVAAEYKQEQEF